MKTFNEPVFRNQKYSIFYEELKSQQHVIECGTDKQKDIYFHFANGNTVRYTKKQFRKAANRRFSGAEY